MRDYALLIVGLLFVAAGAAWFAPGAGLMVAGAGCVFLWWDSDEDPS